MAELSDPPSDLSVLASDLSVRASDLLARVGDLGTRTGEEECAWADDLVARAEEFLDRARLLCEIIRLTREVQEVQMYAAEETTAQIGGQRLPSHKPAGGKPEHSPTGVLDRLGDRERPDRPDAGELGDRAGDLWRGIEGARPDEEDRATAARENRGRHRDSDSENSSNSL